MPAPSDKPKPLPTAALAALKDGQKVTAIKAVRDSEGCDLATAKARVEVALLASPELRDRYQAQVRQSRSSLIFWIVLIDILLVGGAAYWYFRGR